MGRPPMIPVEKKTRIVLSILAGEMTIAEAARREKSTNAASSHWQPDQPTTCPGNGGSLTWSLVGSMWGGGMNHTAPGS